MVVDGCADYQLPNWWGAMADRWPGWLGAVRAEHGSPGSVPFTRVMSDADMDMGGVDTQFVQKMHKA